MHAPARPAARAPPPARIWWSNGIFFVGTHVAAAVAVSRRPPSEVPWQTLLFMVLLWQAASMGITVGYHRLYSHRAFRAAWPVRMLVALLGASAFQGSIKWWYVHFLACRSAFVFSREGVYGIDYTTDSRMTLSTIRKPEAVHWVYALIGDCDGYSYAATKGLLWSHVGWIFYKSRYERLASIEHEDLEKDSVVRMQHEYYIPLALLMGFGLPVIVGFMWNDPVGSFVYAGLVARLLIWHCTFLVNSLAHWDGLQPYSDDNTSKSNLVLALLTCGEGNHNFHHSFPHDFRSGPSPLDWDPSKWAIILLHSLGLASGLRRARTEEISAAREYMLRKKITHGHAHADDVHYPSTSGSEEEDDAWEGPFWTTAELEHASAEGRCFLLLEGFAVDATEYLAEHPGGAQLLRRYAIGAKANKGDSDARTGPGTGGPARDADWAFHGGINKHSQAARRRMRQLRVARVL